MSDSHERDSSGRATFSWVSSWAKVSLPPPSPGHLWRQRRGWGWCPTRPLRGQLPALGLVGPLRAPKVGAGGPSARRSEARSQRRVQRPGGGLQDRRVPGASSDRTTSPPLYLWGRVAVCRRHASGTTSLPNSGPCKAPPTFLVVSRGGAGRKVWLPRPARPSGVSFCGAQARAKTYRCGWGGA